MGNLWTNFDRWCSVNNVAQDHPQRLLLRGAWLSAYRCGAGSRQEDIDALGRVIDSCDDLIRESRFERDRLRSALGAMLTQFGMDEDEWNKPTFDQARQSLGERRSEKERLMGGVL